MRIARIRLKNWLRFRGEHVLDLGSIAYAVVAQRTEDRYSSNWCGKSSLLEAVDFALTGRHRHRTEDEWISHGEKSGEVELILTGDEGETRVLRSRSKKTSLYVGADARDDEAQILLDRIIGLSPEDFRATAYFEQGAMANFVRADPGPRMATVSGWLKLKPIQRCEDRADDEVSAIAKEIEQRTAAIAGLRARVEAAQMGNTDLETTHKFLAKWRPEVERLTDALAQNASLATARDLRGEYEELVKDVARLREELAAMHIDERRLAKQHAEDRMREIESGYALISREREQKRSLVYGNWNGQCPVAGIACPAKEQIGERWKENWQQMEASDAALDLAEENLRKHRSKMHQAEAEYQEADRVQVRLEAAQRRIREMLPRYEKAILLDEPEDMQAIRSHLVTAQQQLTTWAAEEQSIVARVREVVRLREEIARVEREIAVFEQAGARWREAAVIFGKNGAQRRVAEGSLAEIERQANERLRRSGIALTAELRWSREGGDLARACEACGHPFPKSARVKVCERCGAGRGKALVNKLEVVLSDWSGAAADLAGIAIRLSAGDWLRRSRGSAWGSIMMDEPFGQLDQSHRRAFGSHLTSMLGSEGVEQAFVVAHTPDVLDSLPGRIEIVASGPWSTVRIAA